MRSEADDGRPETSPDTGARRNSQNKDSSSKKLSNTPLPIHRCPQVQARKQRTMQPVDAEDADADAVETAEPVPSGQSAV